MSWLLNQIPWWAFAVAIIIALLVCWQYFVILPRWLQSALVSIAALWLVYVAGRNRARRDELERRQQLDAQANARRKGIDNANSAKSDSDLDRDIDKWMRD